MTFIINTSLQTLSVNEEKLLLLLLRVLKMKELVMSINSKSV